MHLLTIRLYCCAHVIICVKNYLFYPTDDKHWMDIIMSHNGCGILQLFDELLNQIRGVTLWTIFSKALVSIRKEHVIRFFDKPAQWCNSGCET